MRAATIGSLVAAADGRVLALVGTALTVCTESDRGGQLGLRRNAPGRSAAKEPWTGFVSRALPLAGMTPQCGKALWHPRHIRGTLPADAGRRCSKFARKANPRKALLAFKSPVVMVCSRRVSEVTRQRVLEIG